MAGRRTRPSARGFTLIEIMIVVVLLGLVMTVAVRGLRSLTKSDMRGSAVKMAGAIRYLFDRASTTGKIHRLVIDFDQGRYWAEVSDDRFYIPRERETDLQRDTEAQERAKEEDEAQKKREEEERLGAPSEPSSQYDISRYQPKEFEVKRARFSAFKEMVVKPAQVKGAKLYGLFTPRLAAPMNTGRGYIYFFPLGMTEAALVYLADEDQKNVYSLVVHPLTGRVQIFNRYIDPPVDKQYDDEGNEITHEAQ